MLLFARGTDMTEADNIQEQFVDNVVRLRNRIAELETRDASQIHAFEALKQCEVTFREIVQNVNSIILGMGTDGTVLFMNHFGLHFFGYAKDEIIGRNVIGTIVPAADTAGRDLAAMIRDIGLHPDRYKKNENENMRRSGERVWIAWSNRALYDRDGDIREILCVGNDLTEHKRAERELEHQRYLLSQRLKELNCLYALSRAMGRIDSSTEETLQEIVGVVPSGFELSERTCAQIRIDDTVVRTEHFTETAWSIESPVISHGRQIGSVTVCYLDEHPPRDEGPFLKEERNLINAVAATVGRYITRRRAQEALEASEIKYKTLFENLPQHIWYKDKNLVYISCNASYARDFGLQPDAVAGITDYDLYPREEAERYREDDTKVLASCMQSAQEEAHVVNGREIVYHKIKTPVRDARGAVDGLIGIFIDITELKKYQKEKARFETAIQNNITEISIKNEISEVLLSARGLTDILHMILVGATAYQALGFNRAFLFLINEQEKTLEGKVATGALSPDEAYRTWARLAQERHTLTELLKANHGEFSKDDEPINRLVKKITISLQDRESVFARSVFEQRSFNIVQGSFLSPADRDFTRQLGTDSFALVPLVCREKALGVLLADNFINRKPISDRDVAGLRAFANHASLAIENSRLYNSLEEKIEELSLANRELSENRDKLIKYERLSVVGEMAAKIAHDIRNPMTAIGGFARRMLKKDMGEEANRHYTQIIVQEVDRLEKILNDLLCFTKPAEPHFAPADINATAKSAFEILSLEGEQHNIAFVERYDVSIPRMYIDADQLRRVFINLYKNAIEAMPAGGTITVSTAMQDREVTVEIADTGMGITEEEMEKIFEPFFTNKATGSGLGLTLVSQIVSSHGGTMEVSRGEPAGTVVSLHLPLRTSPPGV